MMPAASANAILACGVAAIPHDFVTLPSGRESMSSLKKWRLTFWGLVADEYWDV